MLCPISREVNDTITSKIKRDLIIEIDRLEALIDVYSDRDRVKYDELMTEKHKYEMQLLEVM